MIGADIIGSAPMIAPEVLVEVESTTLGSAAIGVGSTTV
jgi:hypothetical protein